MIKVTVWNEFVQEQMDVKAAELFPGEDQAETRQWLIDRALEIKEVHHGAIHDTLKALLEEDEEIKVCHVATLDMEECGLTKEVLDDTDVLVYWAHIAHDKMPDEIAERIRDYVLRGMGFIALHSAHPSKPMQKLLGTSGTLQWREGDFCRVWNTCPTHPIAQGIPASFELEEEEMYGEFFDIPKPDDQVFISWYRGGEVFRSGCTWTRGYGKIFYFQPGHETNRSYFNENVRKIIRNAVKWAKPVMRVGVLECPNAVESPESKYQK
ncbi:MAG TPA: ThuA domain-containing protein [Candidatus Scybalocola faecigallinarum]|uniref:ThuA domain-containing protein n=1 Tax=Candidatus Scybalocola faecigallinarum TaxID=2840941 RepID=A0A9D1F712_9FIRM|nr:ThuA domain-containing protein [Candidatus Scybalocola faecigallinarum]